MDDYTPEQYHQFAERSRESGDYTTALEYCDLAMIYYQKSGNVKGFARIRDTRFRTLRQLYEQTNDRNYLILAKNAALSSVEIAQSSNLHDEVTQPLFDLAKAQELLGQLQEAVISYQEAVDNIMFNPNPELNRPADVVDIKLHLATCKMKAGDMMAKTEAEQLLQELLSTEEPDPQHKNYLLALSHLRIAEALHQQDINTADYHLRACKKVIDDNPIHDHLIPRWEKTAKQFKYNPTIA